MTSPEAVEPVKKGIAKWKFILGGFLLLMIIGFFSGGSDSSDSNSSTPSAATTSQKADLGTRMACEHWRINLRNAAVETLEQQVTHAQKVNEYASISTIPEIVSNARLMTEAFITQDSEAYLTYGTAFGNACSAAGQ
jgi:hypothetical protein